MISFQYFGLLIITVILYWIIPKQTIRNILLILSSFAFIYLMDKWSVVAVLSLTLVSYLFGILINKQTRDGYMPLGY